MSEFVPKPKDRPPSESPMTLNEIADIMGITRERVRQIERKALWKLKAALIKKGITPQNFLPD